eukprot:XP_764525.1 hypothetical protein [Theileria parva strain Muguga]
MHGNGSDYDMYKEDLDTFPDFDSNEHQDKSPKCSESGKRYESDNFMESSEAPVVSKKSTKLSLTELKLRKSLVNKDEKLDIKSLINKLKKNKKLEKEMSTTDSPLTTLLSKISENTPEQHQNKAIQIINEIKNTVHSITNTTTNITNNIDTNSTIGTTDNSVFTSDQVPNTGNSSESVENFETVNDYIVSTLDKQEGLDNLLEESGPDDDLEPFDNKNDLKLLIKFAKTQLTPKDYHTIERLTTNENEYSENRIMNELKSCYGRENKGKKSNHTYYEEGYDQYLYNLQNLEKRADNSRKVHEMNYKFKILMKNKRFINMLKRLNVDKNTLSINNITELLPQQFHFQRLTPTTQLT